MMPPMGGAPPMNPMLPQGPGPQDQGLSLSTGTTILPPYKEPIKRMPVPKLQDVLDLASRLRNLFRQRDAAVRFGREVRRRSMAARDPGYQRTDDESDDWLMRLSQPDSIVTKTASLLADLEETIRLAATENTEAAELAAMKPVAFLREFNEINNRRWVAGGHSDISIDECIAMVEDGRNYWRLICDAKDERAPWIAEPVDCLEVFPHYVGNKLKHVLRISNMFVEDVRAQWGDSLMPGSDDDEEVEIIGYYDERYHGVILNSGQSSNSVGLQAWLKAPKPHDYEWGIPWILVHTNGYGGSSGAIDQSISGEELEANRARGVIWSYIDEFDGKARLWNALIRQVNKSVDPPLDYEVAEGDVNAEAPSDEPGAPNAVKQGLKYPQRRELGSSDLAHVAALSNGLDEAITSGLIPLAQMDSAKSGFDRSIIIQQGETYFKPLIKSLKIARKLRYEAALTLFKQFGVETVVIGTSEIAGQYLWPFTPAMVPDNPRVTVDFEELNQINKMQAIGALVPAITAGAISPYFLHETIGTKDPAQEMQRAYEHMALMHPAVQANLAPAYGYLAATQLAAARTERQDPKGAMLFEMVARASANMIQQAMAAQAQQGQPGQPGAGGGSPQGNSPPLPGGPPPGPGGQGGITPEMMATILNMQQQGGQGQGPSGPNGLPPQLAQILAQQPQGLGVQTGPPLPGVAQTVMPAPQMGAPQMTPEMLTALLGGNPPPIGPPQLQGAARPTGVPFG